jgi:hypothetical protein
MPWTSLKKGPVGLHVTYGKTFTNNLSGHDTQVRTEPALEISIDLNRNLHARNQPEKNGYLDARKLADGDIEGLETLTIYDRSVLDRLAEVLSYSNGVGDRWTLSIELEGTHSFTVIPEARSNPESICLTVDPSK